VPQMRRQGAGRIVNIGSVLGFLPMPYMALYSATKHAVAGYTESLDHELRRQGIRVSVVEPAYIKTPFDANLMKPDAPLDVYREIRVGVERRVKEVLAGAEGPDVVAAIVVKAAMAANPRIHYAPGLARRLRMLRRFAPARMLDAGVRRDLHLEA
jgi:short-subunit dehydrogenase